MEFDFNEFDKEYSNREFGRFIKEIIHQGKKGTFSEFCKVYELDENEVIKLLKSIRPYGNRNHNVVMNIHGSVLDGIKKWLTCNPDLQPEY